MEYLRSRIRLTRALATIIPGLMIAFLLAVDGGDAGIWWTVVALYDSTRLRGNTLLKTLKAENAPFYRPPKTYNAQRSPQVHEACSNALRRRERSLAHLRHILYDEVWIALLLLTLAGVVLVLKTGIYELLSVVLVGLVLTIVVGWTWWRISITFYTFVRNYAKYGEPPAPDSST